MAVLYYELVTESDINWGTGIVTKRNPGGGVLAARQVSIRSLGVGQEFTEVVWDPPSVLSLAVATLSVTVPGAAIQDFVLIAFSVPLAGLLMFAQVIAPNTVLVTVSNPTGLTVDLPSGTLRILVLRAG
jgi:hypothetical protein